MLRAICAVFHLPIGVRRPEIPAIGTRRPNPAGLTASVTAWPIAENRSSPASMTARVAVLHRTVPPSDAPARPRATVRDRARLVDLVRAQELNFTLLAAPQIVCGVVNQNAPRRPPLAVTGVLLWFIQMPSSAPSGLHRHARFEAQDPIAAHLLT